MVGWDSYSIGYHGDDGGIYFEGGNPVEKTGKSMKTGDIVGVFFDAQRVCSLLNAYKATNRSMQGGGAKNFGDSRPYNFPKIRE